VQWVRRGTAAVARQFRVGFWMLELSARQQNLARIFFNYVLVR
jgi:hypothetical protein